MKLQGLILICLLLSLGGCSGSDDATAEASPTPQATKQVAGDDAAPNKKPGAKPGAKKGAKKQTVAPSTDPQNVADFAEAEKAFAAGRYRDAAVIANNSLDALKSDEAPRAEIMKRMDYVAQCQVKAGMYEKACANYASLVKAEPSNKDYPAALKSTRTAFWDKVLAPKLAEAERLRDNKRYSSARSIADEVRSAALKVGLSTDSVDKVMASIDKAQGQVAQSRPQGQEEAVAAAPVPVVQTKSGKKPKKATAKAVTETGGPDSYPSYPTSNGVKKTTPKRKS
jgi:hypothetical protein